MFYTLRSSLVAAALIGAVGCVTDSTSSTNSAPDDFAARGTVPQRRPASLPPFSGIPARDLYSVDPEADATLTCDELWTWLKADAPDTVERFLDVVKTHRPEYLGHHTFFYETTTGFDASSLLRPRIVAFGGDAKTVMSLAGHPKQPFAGRIKVQCFDEAQSKFTYHDLAFPKQEVTFAPARAEASAALSSEEMKQPWVNIPGGRGVRTCANCHEERPIQDTYALWPGAFGAVDDSLTDRDRPDTRNIYNSFESRMWVRFQSIPAQQGRYAYFKSVTARPNSDLTLKLSYLNGRRIVRELKALGPKFEAQKYAFAQALFCAPKAERRFFRQVTGDSGTEGTFAVLPDDSDQLTREIFLSAYYDQMRKERRLGATLAAYQIPSPLPKEHFEDLRKHYVNLLDPKSELNLDMRFSLIDADEVLLVRSLRRVLDPLSIDIEAWSMVRDGGVVHENGRGGDGKVALRLISERPFAETFLGGDKDLSEKLSARQVAENAYFKAKQNQDDKELKTAFEAADLKLCNALKAHVK